MGALESDGACTAEGESGETATETAIDGLRVVSLLRCGARTLLSKREGGVEPSSVSVAMTSGQAGRVDAQLDAP